jgi:hypothetical protein
MIRRLLIVPLLLIVMAGFAATDSHAQFRTLPQNAKFALLGEAQPLPFVQLDGKLLRLAPGGIIYDENNRSIVHGALPAKVRVAYSIDLSGDIGRIYVLTAQEQALADKKK